MKFSEIIDRLHAGETCTREAWGGGTFIVKQIPQTVPAETVPRMTSLPDRSKALLHGPVSYHDQVLRIKALDQGRVARATTFAPTWEDIFADDWKVI